MTTTHGIIKERKSARPGGTGRRETTTVCSCGWESTAYPYARDARRDFFHHERYAKGLTG